MKQFRLDSVLVAAKPAVHQRHIPNKMYDE
jgi:hypothetical protein